MQRCRDTEVQEMGFEIRHVESHCNSAPLQLCRPHRTVESTLISEKAQQ